MYINSKTKIDFDKAKKKYEDIEEQYLSKAPYYARSGQDKYLNEEVFHDKIEGVFVDLGAYDGVESSNTLFFEESMDWTGLCIEPLKNIFPKLLKYRKCICINCCASGSDGIEKFAHVNPLIRPESPREKGRTSNYEKLSGLKKFYTEQEKQIINNVLEECGGKVEEFEVPCININTILNILPNNNIDLLSVDTEGSELPILKAIDYNKFNIKTIVVEVINGDQGLTDFLKTKGYKKKKEIGYDWIFVKEECNV